MQLKTSYFNKMLFRKNLTRFWPLWAMASFIGAIFPLAMLTNSMWGWDITALEMTEIYYNVVAYGLPTISLIYAILCAMTVWSYLYNARSVGTMHTLPIRREGLFLTNFLSGMAMMLIPYVVTGAFCVLATVACGCFEPVGLIVTILAVLGESFFYFSSATLVAFITGNVFALPALYFILHFLAAGLDLLISLFAQGFLFGLNREYSGAVEYLSPTIYLTSNTRIGRNYIEVERISEDGLTTWTESVLTDIWLENPQLIAIYALVGVALLGCAWALYRSRRSESAGDVVAVGWMKPIFRYGVSVCGAMAGGLALYAIFWGQFQNGNYYDVLPLAVCMAVAGTICYYVASMLLTKSLRVFRGSWKGLGLVAVSVALICGVMHFDVLGVEKRVPEVADVERVNLYTCSNNYDFYPGEDDALIEQVRAIHSRIVADEAYVRSMDELQYIAYEEDENISRMNTYRVTYYLKNGLEVERSYYVPVTRERLADSGTYDYAWNALVNSKTMKARRLYLHDSRLTPTDGHIYVEARSDYGKSNSLSSREAQAVLEAVGRDMMAGNWGDYHWFDRDLGNDYAMDLSIYFEGEDEKGNHLWEHVGIVMTPEMTETVETLVSLDLVERSELKTRRELYPEDYEDNVVYYDEYGAKFNYSGESTIAVIA